MAAFLFWLQWDLVGAERHYVEALRLSPGDVLTHGYYASLLSALGRVEEAVQEARRMIAMGSVPSQLNWALGDRFHQAGYVEEARGFYQRAVRAESPVPWAFIKLAMTYAVDEPMDLARAAEMLSGFATSFGYPHLHRLGPLVEALGGDSDLQAEATAVLDDIVALTVLERADLFWCYARVAPNDVFFDLIDEAVRARHHWVPWFPIGTSRVNPALFDDPRWTEFLAKIGHPGIGPS